MTTVLWGKTLNNRPSRQPVRVRRLLPHWCVPNLKPRTHTNYGVIINKPYLLCLCSWCNLVIYYTLSLTHSLSGKNISIRKPSLTCLTKHKGHKVFHRKETKDNFYVVKNSTNWFGFPISFVHKHNQIIVNITMARIAGFYKNIRLQTWTVRFNIFNMFICLYNQGKRQKTTK